ncbi:serine hydrolase [Aurantiacibacter spongiae]|uniref:Serine hydrolase n=1 Tax=Aurantiacibacter spongiae TaxID=2488860 RepID=A0A3N5DF72_9SPHN|nr:serine hydrolase [Aurantiacibacter spongiae]RPF70302.1 serine hydrolase [Aurantiacibacter spongiae]
MSRRHAAALFLALPALAFPVIANAQTDAAMPRLDTRAADIVAVMRGEKAMEEVFSDSFNAQISADQMQAITAQLEAQFGGLEGVDAVEPMSETLASIRIRMERGIASGGFRIAPDQDYKVTEFRLTDTEPLDDSPQSLLADVAALPGAASVLVTRLGSDEPLLAHNADRQFAIGSAFKLYVLSALAHSIAAGERSWEDVVPLTARSYPSGQLQNWPAGSPVTLHTLATLMISISDNTAADQLIRTLGREAIAAELLASVHSDPSRTLPFMTTREMFVMKSGDEVSTADYPAMSEADRTRALDSLASVDRDMVAISEAFSDDPNAIDVEWFASAEDIVRIFDRIRALDDDTALKILAVSPSVSPSIKERWDYIGYKGGSEPGVLNLSWLLRNDAGEWSVVTMSWNDPGAPVDQRQFELIALRALALAAD